MIIDYDKYIKYEVDLVPVRHKKKDLFKINVRLSPTYRQKIDSIGQMDRTIGSFVLSMQDYLELVQEAHSVNAHWSTKIEGNNMSLREVQESSRRIIRSRGIVVAEDPGPNQEILNHLYAYFLPNSFELPWSLDTVSYVHRILMNRTGEECIPGRIREDATEEMCIMADDQVMFECCPSIHVKTELEQLLDWISNSPLDRIVMATVFFHEFESIHPFTEGNGRVGRSLFHILMQELGYSNFNMCKIEDKLLGNSSVYYNLIRYTDKSGDYTALIEFFVDCIYAAYSEAVREYGEKDVLKGLDENSKVIATMARKKRDWFSLMDANEWVDGIGSQSVRSRLNDLVDKQVIEKRGSTRSLVYRFNDPFRPIKEALVKNQGNDGTDVN